MRQLYVLVFLLLSPFYAAACGTGPSTASLKEADFGRNSLGILTMGMVAMRGLECGKDFMGIDSRFDMEELSAKVYNETQFKPSARCVAELVREKFRCD